MIVASYMQPRRKAVWGTGVRFGLTALVATVSLATAGCGDAVRGGTGSSYLVVNSLEGASGTDGTFGPSLQSDVINEDPQTGDLSIAPDRGQATVQLVMKDLGGPGPSAVNAITLTQYHVEYIRSDGRNTQGVDVPFAFDGGLTITVNGTTSVGFTLVRIQAKKEAPLTSLQFHGGANTISTIARVTFYGHDQTGRGLSVTGQIEVDFNDWAG
jgi:hypothetical protein